MPGLVRRDPAHLDYSCNQDDPLLTGPPLPTPTPLLTSAHRRGNVHFIPEQMDPVSATTTQAARQNPLRLFIGDAGVLLSMLGWLPWIFLPFRTSNRNAELYLSLVNLRDMALQGVLFGWETLFLVLALPIHMLLPGTLSIPIAVGCCLFVVGMAKIGQGPTMVYSKMDEATTMRAKQYENERWLFVNGIATGSSGLQKNINALSQTFGRPVIGIHNKTYGLIADLLECLIQRDFSYNTMDVRVTYDYLKACLSDPTISKIVLVAHSQGGIIVSMALDYLFADLPHEVFAKLEVYTFGSAAAHFNSPLVLRPANSPNDVGELSNQRCVQHIEHYCNEHDLVARWGALYNIGKVLDNRYCGTVFVRMGASGHLFNQHYLDVIFPQPNKKEHMNGLSNGLSKLDGMANAFLDAIVDVNEGLAVKREDTALNKMGVMRQESQGGSLFEDSGEKTASRDGMPNGQLNGCRKSGMTIEYLNGGIAVDGNMRDARGKSVRELSRLWMYLGGGSPQD